MFDRLSAAAWGVGGFVLSIAFIVLMLDALGKKLTGEANATIQAGIAELGSTSGMSSWLGIIVTVVIISLLFGLFGGFLGNKQTYG